jgi:hypothetical protein
VTRCSRSGPGAQPDPTPTHSRPLTNGNDHDTASTVVERELLVEVGRFAAAGSVLVDHVLAGTLDAPAGVVQVRVLLTKALGMLDRPALADRRAA